MEETRNQVVGIVLGDNGEDAITLRRVPVSTPLNYLEEMQVAWALQNAPKWKVPVFSCGSDEDITWVETPGAQMRGALVIHSDCITPSDIERIKSTFNKEVK